MKFKFEEYDIEVLKNIYTLAVYKPHIKPIPEIDIYYLTKDKNLFVAQPGEYYNELSNVYYQLPEGDYIDPNTNTAYVSHTLLKTLTQDFVTAFNPVFNGKVNLFKINSLEGIKQLLTTFGISNDYTRKYKGPTNEYKTFIYKRDGQIQRWDIPHFVRDVDPEFDLQKHPFLISYNGFQYDTTVFAQLFEEIFTKPNQNGEFTFNLDFSTESLRTFNDQLFTSQFKKAMYKRLGHIPYRPNKIHTNYRDFNKTLNPVKFRQNMLQTGRYIDAARLNEKQQKVALKRLLGMLGCQIMESDKLKPNNPFIENLIQLLELFAYNASDVINLHTLMTHPTYHNSFELRDEILHDYPELIYQEKGDTYSPDINPNKVRWDRLNRDSTSQQLTAMSLFPYSQVTDIKYVSYLYPSQAKCDELNKKYALEIKSGERKPFVQRNILEELKIFYYQLFPQPHVREKFDHIYNFYKNLEGRNFNSTKKYKQDYPDVTEFNDKKEFPFHNSYIYYYDKNGQPTSHYANFSIGGIHGAEYNLKLFNQHKLETQNYNNLLNQFQEQYPSAVDFRQQQVTLKLNGVKTKVGYIPFNGKLYRTSRFLKNKKVAESEYKDQQPILDSPFKLNQKGVQSLNPKYNYTTVALVNHEDFTSYYPSMLIMMSIFYNKRLGYDRYNEIFEQKEYFGDKLKDESLPEELIKQYGIKRNGTKLFLNAAAGGADAEFETSISASNAILSMRSIGQMFTFMVAQYQAYHGAEVPSTNTDGLYTVMEELMNNELLAEISENIGVGIEPELMYLISKDANNRCEMKLNNDGTIQLKTSAGSIGCYNGPDPTKSLSHPALIDRILVDYMIEKAIHQNDPELTEPFDRKLAKQLISKNLNSFTDKKRLDFLQNITTSTATSYIFSSKNEDMSDPNIIQLYNRTFYVTDKNPNYVYLQRATSSVIVESTVKKRQRNHEIATQHDPLALHVMAEHGYTDFEEGTEAKIAKINGIDKNQPMLIYNSDTTIINHDEALNIFKYIDIDAYLDLIEHAYYESWRNEIPTGNQTDSIGLADDSILDETNYHNYIDSSDIKTVTFLTNYFKNEVA